MKKLLKERINEVTIANQHNIKMIEEEARKFLSGKKSPNKEYTGKLNIK